MNKKTIPLILLSSIWLLLVSAFYYFVYQWISGPANLSTLFGLCKIQAYCGDLVGVNCKAEIDGPYFYIKKDTGKIVSTCGGYCRGGCTNCPPKEWTCETH